MKKLIINIVFVLFCVYNAVIGFLLLRSFLFATGYLRIFAAIIGIVAADMFLRISYGMYESYKNCKD